MGTLASGLRPIAAELAAAPRVYVDANLPLPIVSAMRHELGWDVLFVLEHDELRRARDDEHYRLAKQLRRTLITLDRDYLDDKRFPPGESGGVIVLMAPEERGYVNILKRLDEVLRSPERLEGVEQVERSVLEGRKLHVHVDWSGSLDVV